MECSINTAMRLDTNTPLLMKTESMSASQRLPGKKVTLIKGKSLKIWPLLVVTAISTALFAGLIAGSFTATSFTVDHSQDRFSSHCAYRNQTSTCPSKETPWEKKHCTCYGGPIHDLSHRLYICDWQDPHPGCHDPSCQCIFTTRHIADRIIPSLNQGLLVGGITTGAILGGVLTIGAVALATTWYARQREKKAPEFEEKFLAYSDNDREQSRMSLTAVCIDGEV